MHITTFILIIAIICLILSFGVVGFIPSLIVLCLTIYFFLQEKTINIVRAMAISAVGVILPIIMYFSSYGFSGPYIKAEKLSMIPQIIYDNYERLGFDMSFMVKDQGQMAQGGGNSVVGSLINQITIENADSVAEATNPEDAIYYVTDGVATTLASYDNEIFEDIGNEENIEAASTSTYIGASDDDMPSYGGLPVGTLVLAQYFREDDHNCNPVLVLRNKTGSLCRYECMFIARDENGDEMAISRNTVEVVKDGDCFVFEGRFDKNDLGGRLPAMYEFSITKRKPYEVDASDQVAVYTRVSGNSAIVTADNTGDTKVKVDTYVLFFDKDELVDCIWLIPQNTNDVCVAPFTTANIKGDAYYHFDRVETYYTAYEAVGN